MSTIEQIKAKLSADPEVRYSASPDHIEVHPKDPSGFTVGLRITASGFTVYFEGWHEEFASEDEALDCFAFGLSPTCRLAIVFRGETATRWIVQGFENGAWTPDSETGLFLQPLWRSARVEYRRNRVLDVGDAETSGRGT